MQGFAMKARDTAKTITCSSACRRFWRWPLAFGLALALLVSLFHDLPALGGTGDPGPIPVAGTSFTSSPVQPSDTHAPAVGCHCLCHLASQAIASPVVTPVIFGDSLRPLRDSTALPSC